MEPLFPEIPEDLAALSPEDLVALRDGIRENRDRLNRIRRNEASDEDVAWLDGREIDVDHVIAALGETGLGRVDAEITRRDEDAARLEAELDAALAGPEQEPEPEPEAQPDQPDEQPETTEVETETTTTVTQEAEPIAAAARRVLPARAAARQPRRAEEGPVTITASADIPGVTPGRRMESVEDIADAMMARRKTLGVVAAGSRVESMNFPVATIHAQYPEDRVISDQAGAGTAFDQIVRAGAPSRDEGFATLTAAGGICAPPVNVYNFTGLPHLATRPIRDSFPGFAAARGGVAFPSTRTLADVPAGAYGHITAAQDAAGGSPAVKGCVTFPCPTWATTDVDILYRCLQFGNLNARTLPEDVAEVTRLAMAFWARSAEGFLLDRLNTLSTAVTMANSTIGAGPTFLHYIELLTERICSAHRLSPDTRFQAILPQWLPGMLLADYDLRQFRTDAFVADEPIFTAALARRGIDATYTPDQRTGGAEQLAAPTGTVGEWPDTFEFYLFPAGTFVYLDGGTLDLGLVRDSTLNSTNAYNVFYESFENIAKVGPLSYKVTSPLSVTGATAAPVTVTDL